MSEAARNGALLVNDTSAWYHYGCSCTSLGIHAELRRQWRAVRSLPIHRVAALGELPLTLDEFDDDVRFERFSAAHPDVIECVESCDAVYVNGEGTMHGLGAQAIALLYLAYISKQRFGRPVHLINHSCFPDGTTESGAGPAHILYKRVYEVLDFVAVREGLSAKLLGEMGIDAQLSFDCLPLFVDARFDRKPKTQSKTIVIAGSVAWGGSDVVQPLGRFVEAMRRSGHPVRVLIGADSLMAGDDVQFVEGLKRTIPDKFELFVARSELEWLRAIADAALLVSGRFHHSIAAAFVDTPFVVMESNTPKIAGLMQMLESDAFLSVRETDLAGALEERARERLTQPHEFLIENDVKTRLLALSRNNFRGLSAAQDSLG
jgi:polysaccharide pyruvyl transferase WcaK-like protein